MLRNGQILFGESIDIYRLICQMGGAVSTPLIVAIFFSKPKGLNDSADTYATVSVIEVLHEIS